ncbi:YetF domain-containing protein [Paenibacillus xanthanilyticus]|uniref:YetF domain-containing protein n=1 Tax=Paenibacillus xanthanilyticus TaxID=1783531 RepID=A0ABV8K815_9BACL
MEVNELLGMLREKDIFSIREVRFAFIETDGNVSVIKGEKLQYGQAGLSELPTPLIMDGRIVRKSLQRLRKSDSWLYHELKKKSIDDIQEVFYAEYLEGHGLLVQTQLK